MKVIAVSRVREYQEAYPNAAKALSAWLTIAKKAKWQTPQEVQQVDPKVSILKDGRLVFNIAGNNYRLIVKVNYVTQSIFIRWFGTHPEYDKIDANSV